MKRILLVFLIVVSAAVFGFAQELKFDGYVNSGLGFWFSDQSGVDPQVEVYGVDSERNIGRIRLNGAFTNEAKTAGINFRFQVQGSTTLNTPSLAFGYGWVTFAKMITIKAGLVDDGTWATGDVIFNDDQSEGAGLLVKVSPIKGLDFGAGAYAASYASGSNNNTIDLSNWSRNYDDIKYTFNAGYTMDKVFRVMVSGRIKNATGGDTANTEPSQILGELRLLAVPNLTAVVAARFITLDDFSDNGLMQFYETFGYKIKNFAFGLNAAQYFSNNDAHEDFGLRFNPWLSYAFNDNKIIPRLDVVYFMGGRSGGSSADYGKGYHRRNFTADYIKDTFVLNARPSVKFNLNPMTVLEFGDSFYYTKINSGDAVISNAVYVDMTFKF